MIQALVGNNPAVEGLWQRLDPRVKLICIFSLAAAVVVTPIRHYQKFIAYGSIIILLALISRVKVKYYLLRFIFLLPLLLFLGASLLLFSQQQWSQKQLILYNLFVKAFLTFCSFGVLGLTMKFHQIVKSLELMRFPKIFTSVLGFAYRYVLLFQQEAGRMIKARKSRSFGKRKKWRDRKGAAFIVPFFLFRVLERSQRIYIAMLSRGYRDVLPAGTSFRLTLTYGDYLFAIGFHLLLVFILVLL
ncbi:energy-coupling factor transporter transmembrane component T family protein [Acidobacteriota bacterium]